MHIYIYSVYILFIGVYLRIHVLVHVHVDIKYVHYIFTVILMILVFFLMSMPNLLKFCESGTILSATFVSCQSERKSTCTEGCIFVVWTGV